MRRINCPACGVTIERVPWAEGKSRLTTAMAVFLSDWAKRLSWKQTAEIFGVTWDTVFRAVKSVVAYGLVHRDMDNITAIGIDEVAYQKGHKYMTLVYQIDEGCRRLLHVSEGRTVKSLLRFFKMMGKERSAKIKYVCSDMWKPYLKVVRKKVSHAVHILDRFHIVANLHKALDKIRAAEARELKEQGYEPVLEKTRWCFLKREENLTKKQKLRLGEVLRYDLKSIRAYLKVKAFDALWQYKSPFWAGKFLDAWITNVMRSRLEPLKTVASSLKKHRPLILNWFVAKKQFNNSIVEGLNTNAKLAFRKAYGFRTYNAAQIALYHQLGNRPTPKLTHRFC